MSMKRKAGLVQHLWGREHGLPKRPRTLEPHAAQLLAEEKATLPARNQSCEMSGQSRATFLVDFSPDHTRMASTHGDHSVRVTDIKTGRCSHVLTGHPRTPWTLAWHPSSNDILASGCLAGEVRIWDLRGGGSEVWKTEGLVISSLTFHPTDQVLVIAAGNYLYFWDWTQSCPFAKCKTAHTEEKVRWVKFDRWGQYLYTGIVNSISTHDEQNDVSYINNNPPEPPADLLHSEERQHLQSRYRDIVEQITRHQRERNQHHDPLDPRRTQPPVASVSHHDGVTYSGPHQADLSMVGPHSPVHLEILEDARHYASHLTQRVQQARQYAAHLTHSTWLGHDDAERQVIRIRNHQADAHDNQPFNSLDNIVANETETTLNDRTLLNNLPSATEVLSALPNTRPLTSSGFDSTASAPSITMPLMVSVPSPSLPYPSPSMSASALMVSMPAVSHASTMQGTSPTVTLTGVSLSTTLTSLATSTTTVSTSSCLSAIPSPRPTCCRSHQDPELTAQPSTLANSTQPHTVAQTHTSRHTSHPRTSNSRSASQAASSQNSAGKVSVVGSSCHSSTCDSSSRTVNSQHSSGATVSAALGPGSSSLLGTLLRTQLRSSSLDSSSTAPVSSRSSIPTVTVIPETSITPASGAAASSSQRPSLLRCHLLAQHSNNSAARGRSASLGHSGSSQAQATEDPASDETRNVETDANQNERQGVEAVGSSGPLGQSEVASSSHLASVVGSEVRNMLERVRSRQIDIQHTLSAFCQLQGPAEPSTSRDVPVTTTVTLQGQTSSDATVSSATTFPSVSSISAEVDRRLENLNQLGHQVSQITQRMGERARNLVQEGNRTLREMRRQHHRSSHRQQPYPSHHRQRNRRLQSILDMWRPYQRMAAAGAAEARPRDANPLASSPNAEENSGRAETDREGVTQLHRRHRQLRVEIENMHSELTRRIHQQRRDPSWFSLQRRTLHPHYSVSILDDTINRSDDGLQAAINRAIAGAFMGVGESAVASNIMSETYRIQRWDFNSCQIPDISQALSNVIVSPCKIHNDASCDISQDGRYLCTFVPSHRGFPDDTILGVFSLEADSLGQCFYTKSFGPNAISVSMSPLNNYVLVGLAAKRLAWVFTQKQMVAQIFKLRAEFAGEDSVEHICDLMHPCELDIRSHITVNSARWLPGVGEGVVYGTNRGDLHICTPGDDERDVKERRPPGEAHQEPNFDQRNLMQMLGLAVPQTMSASTQTVHRIRRSASTQTDTHHERDVD